MIKSHILTVLNFLLLGMKLNTASFLIALVCLSHILYKKKSSVYALKNLSTFSKSDYFLLKELVVPTVCNADIKITQFQHKNPKTLKTDVTKLMIPIIPSGATHGLPQSNLSWWFTHCIILLAAVRTGNVKLGLLNLSLCRYVSPVSSVMLLWLYIK